VLGGEDSYAATMEYPLQTRWNRNMKLTEPSSLSTTFLGRALFDIPKPNPMPNVEVSFSREEALIYR